MTPLQIIRQYPNFYKIRAGGLAVGFIHTLDRGGHIMVAHAKKPGIPKAGDTRVAVSRYTKDERPTIERTISIWQLESWIDTQLGFKKVAKKRPGKKQPVRSAAGASALTAKA